MTDSEDAKLSINRRRSLPAGCNWKHFDLPNGARLRCASWEARSGRPTILFLNGRADFIEKYSEAYWHWRSRDFGLVTFDWLGQGLSSRALAGGVNQFDAHVDELGRVIEQMLPAAGKCVLVAHSMGGHIGLRWLAQNAGKQLFARAILLSPMMGIATFGIPAPVIEFIARIAVTLGMGASFPPGQGRYGARNRSRHRQVRLTSDAERFADEAWWIDGNRALACDGADWRWIAEALASCSSLAAPGVPEAVDIPVDIFMGGGESLVSVEAARRIAKRLKQVKWHEVAGAAHELLRERDEVQHWLHHELDAIIEADQ